MFCIQLLNTENAFSLYSPYCFPECKKENMKLYEDAISRMRCEISFSSRSESIPQW